MEAGSGACRECVGRNEKFWHLCALAAAAAEVAAAAAGSSRRWWQKAVSRSYDPVRRPSMVTHVLLLSGRRIYLYSTWTNLLFHVDGGHGSLLPAKN